jgi:hypothetical protein
MRIERLRIPAFGPLRNLDTGPSPLPGFVVVSGPNEAGKSSLLEAVRSLLHGLYPADRAGHPHAPWDGTEAEVEGWLLAADGERFRVHRRLLATPWGRLERGGTEVDLRNRNTPGVEHVPREIYRQVHAITLPELMRLQQGKAWTSIRDRIMAGMGTRDLAPPRKVADKLSGTADAIWRPNRVGRQRERVLGERITHLTAELRSARDSDREFRRAEAALDEAQATLERLRVARAELGERVRAAREFLPLRDRLEHLDRLDRAASDRSELADLPSDPGAHLRALEAAATEAADAVGSAERALDVLRRGVVEPEPGDVQLLGGADALERMRVTASAGDEAASRALGLESEFLRLQETFADLAGPVLQGDAEALLGGPDGDGEELREALGKIPFDELRALLVERGLARGRLDEVEGRLAEAAEEPAREADAPPPDLSVGGAGRAPARRAWFAGLGLLLVVAAFLLVLIGMGHPALPGLVGVPGALLLAAAGVLHLLDRERSETEARARENWDRHLEAARSRGVEARARLEARREQHREELVAATGAIEALLAGVPVRPGRVETGGEGLASALERVRDGLRQLTRLRASLHTERARVTDALDALSSVAREVGVDPEEPAAAFGSELPSVRLGPMLSRLGEARARDGAYRSALVRVTEAERALAGAREEASRAEGRLNDFRETLARAGESSDAEADDPDRPSSALARVEARLEAAQEARRLRREIEGRYGDLDALRTRIRAALEDSPRPDGEADSMELARAEARLEALGDQVELAVGTVEASQATLAGMEVAATADMVESEIAELREARRQARRERDRYWLLARLTRTAERQFRESHQPELVRRAGELMGRLTGGRYDTLLLGDDDDPDLVQVRGDHLDAPLPVETPLSTGTREQIWFALRMAVVDLVEGGGDPLPLVLDEVFVNWDETRRGAALRMLAALSEHRQVLLVTCHPSFADEASALGARRIELSGPGGGSAS